MTNLKLIALPCFTVFILGPDKELLRKAALNARDTFVYYSKVSLMSRSNEDQRCLHPKPVNKSNTPYMARNSNRELTNRKMDTLSMTSTSKNHTLSSGPSPHIRFIGVTPGAYTLTFYGILGLHRTGTRKVTPGKSITKAHATTVSPIIIRVFL